MEYSFYKKPICNLCKNNIKSGTDIYMFNDMFFCSENCRIKLMKKYKLK